MIGWFIFVAVAAFIGGFAFCVKLDKISDEVANNKLRQENAYLQQQIEKIKQNADYWANQANNTHSIHGQLIQTYNQNTANTIAGIVSMLNALQHSNSSQISYDDRNKIQRMIEQAKGIG